MNCFLAPSPVYFTHHVLHVLWTLELSLAFQPFHIVRLFFILQTDVYRFISSKTFLLTCTALSLFQDGKPLAAATYLLFLRFDPPGQQLGSFTSLAALIVVIIAVLDELTEAEERGFVFHKQSARYFAGHRHIVWVSPCLQLPLLLNVARRGSSLWKQTMMINNPSVMSQSLHIPEGYKLFRNAVTTSILLAAASSSSSLSSSSSYLL